MCLNKIIAIMCCISMSHVFAEADVNSNVGAGTLLREEYGLEFSSKCHAPRGYSRFGIAGHGEFCGYAFGQSYQHQKEDKVLSTNDVMIVQRPYHGDFPDLESSCLSLLYEPRDGRLFMIVLDGCISAPKTADYIELVKERLEKMFAIPLATTATKQSGTSILLGADKMFTIVLLLDFNEYQIHVCVENRIIGMPIQNTHMNYSPNIRVDLDL